MITNRKEKLINKKLKRKREAMLYGSKRKENRRKKDYERETA